MISKRMSTRHILTVMFCGLLVGGVASVLIGAESERTYNRNQMEYYLEPNQLEYIRPGLQVEVQKVEIKADTVIATFRLMDDKDVSLDRTGILTPGEVGMNFVLARIKSGERQYTAYTTAMRANPTTGELLLQASTDSGGVYTDVGDGVYTYTFGTKLPADYDPAVTHSLGIFATRNLREFGLKSYVANAVFDFIPAGGQVNVVRDVVRTENCHTCHDAFTNHHNARQEVRLCVLCHSPQSTDNVSGMTVDFKVLIHKVHRGEDLPSVKAGVPLGPLGHHSADYSEVAFPQDIRNCTVCHQKGAQSDNYMTQPSRAACGACHDDVNFDTGENHGLGGVQVSDSQCTICHAPDTGREFDISVKGAHVIPEKSAQLAGLNFEILSVTGTSPGSKPAVTFKITDNQGNFIEPSKMDRFRLGLGGPTNDSVFHTREDAKQAAAGLIGYTYTFTEAIPAEAKGTFVVAGEGFRDVSLAKVDGTTVTAREAGSNQLFYFTLTDPVAVKRRTIVSQAKCNTCHEKLAVHSKSRSNIEYCSVCHRPGFTDESQRPAEKMPAEAMDFKNLIHKVHSGHDLENEFTIYDAGEPENFNELHYPADHRNCSKCHEGSSYQLPLPQGLLSSVTPRGFFTPTPPATTACLACHDSLTAAAHAFQNIAPFGEGCAACHGEEREFAVSKMHAR